jgi:hypothetical protein
VRPLAIYADVRALLWPAIGLLTGLRVLFPSRLASPSPLPPFARSSANGPTVVPVLRSVRRLLFSPMFPMPVLLHRAAAPLLLVQRYALFAPLCLYPYVALGLM